jgi:hypothetical protein
MTNGWYALVGPDDVINREETNIDPTVPTKAGWRWLPVETDPPQTYNTKTQAAEGPYHRVESSRVVKYWVIREKNEHEQNNELLQKVNSIDPTVFAVLFDFYKSITNNSSVTNEEFKAYIKALL